MRENAESQAAGKTWTDQYWTSPDGLTLHFRDYAGGDGRPPLLCIPGLTRNARDFEPMAERFAGDWRVICAELRGRGESDYARDSSTYNPLQYMADIEALLDQQAIDRFVAIGTSLGGIVTMLLAARNPARIAGAVLNDIGPVIEPAGLARIREYVGQGRSYPTWMHAARALQETSAEAFPRYSISDWLRIAKRLMVIGGNGRIVLDYDMKIAEPLNAPSGTGEVDLWPAYRALAGRPLLVVRGSLSDILSQTTLERMMREVPTAEAVTIADVGHAPSLDEAEGLTAIERMLARCR